MSDKQTQSDETSDIDYKRLFIIGLIVILSAAFGWLTGDIFRTSEDVASHIGVIFSILAASLFAVISIVGDPSMLLSGNRRVAWASAKGLQRRIQRYNFLFVLYILTLGLLVIAELIETAQCQDLYFIYHILSFMTSLCFLCSLTIGYGLSKLQRDRMENEVAGRD